MSFVFVRLFCMLTVVQLLMGRHFCIYCAFHSLVTIYCHNILIHSGLALLHFYNIHPCQLTIRWMTKLTRRPIVVNAAYPNHFLFQCFRQSSDLQITAYSYTELNLNCP